MRPLKTAIARIGALLCAAVLAACADAALVGYWPLDDAGDSSPKDCTSVGASLGKAGTPVAAAGRFGLAADLDNTGVPEYLDVNPASGLPNIAGAQTLSAWFRYPSAPASQTQSLLSLSNVGQSAAIQVGFQCCGGAPYAQKFGGTTLVSTTTVYSANVWHHMAYTLEPPNTHRLYVDGVLVDSANVAQDSASPDLLMIGGILNYTADLIETFHGQIDEVRIYDHRLTDSEIADLYQSGNQIRSRASGPWSSTSTWREGTPPLKCAPATVNAGHFVTVDITTATASTTTVRGTLSFSGVANSSFTLVAGSMTVASGGRLTLGTEASPIPSTITAHLVLARGGSAGQYGLDILDGGVFTVRGATKTPVAQVLSTDDLLTSENTMTLVEDPFAMGWSTGDVITISPGNVGSYGQTTVEERRIAQIAGNVVTVDSNFSRVHYGTWTIHVANLTRNVLVRSSGTVVDGAGANSSYIRSLSRSATSFSLAYGEFAHLGANSAYIYGISVETPSTGDGAIRLSSSSIHHGYVGVYPYVANNVRITRNVFYKNWIGIQLDIADGAVAEDNHVLAQDFHGISFSYASGYLIKNNHSYGNTGEGIYGLGGNVHSFVGNRSYANANGGSGIHLLDMTGALVASNETFGNIDYGIFLENPTDSNGNHFLVDNFSYGNGSNGLFIRSSRSNQAAGGALGYTRSGTAIPNAGAEVQFDSNATAENLVLKDVRVNPAVGVGTAGLNRLNAWMLSYKPDGVPGTLDVRGDFTFAASTITLDAASELYPSTASGVRLQQGTGHSATLVSLSTNAVTQLISVEFRDGQWHVDGSSSGLSLRTFTGSQANLDVPLSNPMFRLNFTQGTPADRDRLHFALIGGSGDAGIQKRLRFGRTSASINAGRSKMTAAPSAGLVLRGSSGAHALAEMIPGGTYYTLVSSGAFTASFASMSWMDSGGLQLSGSAGVSLSSTVFDNLGIVRATSAYITARSLTSNRVIPNASFLLSQSTNGFAYNVLVEGAFAGLSWQFNGGGGAFWGEAFDGDVNDVLSWGGSSAPSAPAVSQVFVSSITVGFGATGADAYVAEASTAANFTGSLFISSQAGAASALTIGSLAANTTYFLRVGAVWSGSTFYADVSPASTATLAALPTALNFSAIGAGGFTVNWTNNNPAGTLNVVRISTDIGFSVQTASATTAGATQAFSGLSADTTYFVRLHAVNHNGVPSASAFGVVVTRTTPGVLTISANRLPTVWYNSVLTLFFAQGAVTYRYNVTPNPTDVPGGGDPSFDGSALAVNVPEGVFYFHVIGVGGAGDGQVAHFGPLNIDLTQPAVTGLAAQVSVTNPSPIPDGGSTVGSTPRFTWNEPASASPIIGYSLSVSSDSADVPPLSVLTSLPAIDRTLSYFGVNYVKVRALDLSGNWGPPAGLSFTFTNVPTASSIILKSNYFNPTRGECMTLDVFASSGGRLKAELYNMLEQKVGTLANLDVSPGIYSYGWCGRNQAGEVVATGVYLLRVEAPQEKKTLKVIIGK